MATECGTVRQNEKFLWEKQKNITLFKLEGGKKTSRIAEEIKYTVTGKEITFLKEIKIEATERHLYN